MTAQQILADLARAFPRQKIDRDQFAVLVSDVSDVPPDVLERVCKNLRRTSEWFPSIRAIREAAAEDILALPREVDALAQVEALASWTRQDGPVRATRPPAVHPLVRAALDAVGGSYAFRTASEPAVIRGQFLRLFRDGRQHQIADAQVGNLSLALPPGEPAAAPILEDGAGSRVGSR